ncbi:MAG: hypothetical protein ACRDQ0_22140 [Pseudonocardia sp.]
MHTLPPRGTGRAHLAYTDPHPIHGTWTCTPRCLPDRGTAEVVQDGITALAGPDARARRTWTISACTYAVAS